MSLLTNVMDHSLDDGYAEATARRGETRRSGLPRTARTQVGLASGLVLVALVITLGAAQAREAAPTLAREREGLIDRIQEATGHADDLQDEVAALRGKVDAAQNKALDQHGDDSGARLMSLLAGATRVSGPGVKLVVNDAKGAAQDGGQGPRGSTSFADSGRLRDRDLQRVVNGLWEQGAEAVAINGQRLTALSAIRAAGDAILVDNKPLPPPYTVLAIGDGERFKTGFHGSADGRYLSLLEENFGIRASVSVQNEVHLPAAPRFTVRSASPVPKGPPASSSPGPTVGAASGGEPHDGRAPEAGERSKEGSGKKRGTT